MQPILRFATNALRSSGRELLTQASQSPIQRPSIHQDVERLQHVEKRVFRSFERSVAKSYPDHEVTHPKDYRIKQGTTWVLVPISGTFNWVRRSDQFCSLLGIYHDRSLRYGLIVDHFRDGEYRVERKQGCFSNAGRMRVSDLRDATQSIVAIDDVALANQVAEIGAIPRMTGSAGLDIVHTAVGKLDGLMLKHANEFEFQLSRLFVREAGGFATTLNGGEWRHEKDGVVAGNTFVHRKLVTKKPVARQLTDRV